MNIKKLLENTLSASTMQYYDISGESLERIKPFLLNLDEFKNVKILNILTQPVYDVDINENPIGYSEFKMTMDNEVNDGVISFKANYNLTDNQRHTQTYKYNEKLIFNEIVDIYSIGYGPKSYDFEKLNSTSLGQGVWLLPTIYNPVNFTPLRELKLIWSPDSGTILENINTLENMLQEIKNVLTKDEINIPHEVNIFIRCSSRSIINK